MGVELTRDNLPAKEEEGGGGDRKPPFNPEAAAKEEAAKQGGDKPPVKEESTEYVYPDDASIPEPLRGKKASEAVGVFNTLQTLSQGVVKQLRTMQQQQEGKREPAKPIFDKDEFVTGEPDKIEEKLATLFEKKATPFMVDMYSGLSQMAMNQAESALPYFKKYKSEILAEATQQPVNQTARFNTWKDIHDRVAARHVNEIAAEMSKPKPPAPVIERGGGGGGPAVSDEVELDVDDRKIADGLGVSHKEFLKMKKLYASNA